MRVESIAKKVSCIVLKTSFPFDADCASIAAEAGNEALTMPWDEHCRCCGQRSVVHTKPVTQINLPKRALDMAGVLSRFAPQGRLLDYYA
jgi:hypothetical protein